MRPQLSEAIDGLYAQFRASPPERIDACPCCRDPANYRPLHQKALRNLTSDELGPYTTSALLTVGALPDLKYFLPRIFELAALEPYAWPDIEIRLSKLKHGGCRAWSPPEQKALERFLSEWLEELLSESTPDADIVDSLVCGMAGAGCDIGPVLERIGRSQIAAAALCWHNARSLMKKKQPTNAFWAHTDPRLAAQYVEWLETAGR